MFETGLGLEVVELALKEDIPFGDITAEAIFENNSTSVIASIKTKEDCIVAGLPAVKKVLTFFPDINLTVFKQDGEFAGKGSVIYTLSGSPLSLLKAERTMLNFLQRLSGIATKTHTFVKLLEGSKIKILDTRKTTPGYRLLEKYAVKTGGGKNHRFSLSDGILIKENHIKAAGSLHKAVRLVKESVNHLLKVEVEVENLEQLDNALNAGADGVLLDNMSNEDIALACRLKESHKFFIEVSGNVTEERLPSLKELNIDFISSGAITHSAGIIDLTMLF
jgi:nicotinate-nucleotide pyrophosphorylase (carboxylating)